jgi:hypothetical protein
MITTRETIGFPCIYIYIYTIGRDTYTYILTCIYIYIHMCIYIYIFTACLRVYIIIYICLYIYIWVCNYKIIYMCVYPYVYIYVYIHKYVGVPTCINHMFLFYKLYTHDIQSCMTIAIVKTVGFALGKSFNPAMLPPISEGQRCQGPQGP